MTPTGMGSVICIGVIAVAVIILEVVSGSVDVEGASWMPSTMLHQASTPVFYHPQHSDGLRLHCRELTGTVEAS